MKCKKFLEKIAEKTNINFNLLEKQGKNYYIEFEYWSDLGEDVIICFNVDKLTKESIIEEMYNCKEAFDADEHATELFNMRGSRGTPTNLRALLKDADEQAEKLEEIYKVMKTINKKARL